MKCFTLFLFLAASLTAPTTHADPGETARFVEFSRQGAGDAALSGFLGGLTMGSTVTLLGVTSLGEYGIDGDSTRHLYFISGGMLIIGVPLTAAVITAYSDARGSNGSFGATLAGTYLGAGAGIGLCLAGGCDSITGLVTTLVVLPSVGGLVGYVVSDKGRPRPQTARPSGTLLDLDERRDWTLRMPAVRVGVTDADMFEVSVSLLDGRW